MGYEEITPHHLQRKVQYGHIEITWDPFGENWYIQIKLKREEFSLEHVGRVGYAYSDTAKDAANTHYSRMRAALRSI